MRTKESGSQPPLGLVGLGLLGSAIARKLLRASWPVQGHDLAADRAESLAAEGLEVGDCVSIARQCDLILLSLPSSREVSEVVAQLLPDLRSGSLIVDTTTGDPEATGPLVERLGEHGVGYLDATISGSSADLEQGQAIAMVGGPVDQVGRVAPLLDLLVRRWYHVGLCGSGARMKLVTNLVLGLNRAVLGEALGLASAMGLDLAATLAVLRDSAAYSRVMDTKGQKMLTGDFTPQARLAQHLKDVRLILAEGARTGARLPLSAVHRALLESLEALGLGHLDNSVIIRAFLPEAP